ncbi:MAG TPA: hypothetical protein VF556_12705 [Pyrinomonadaceae bacterium]|jgi:predicted ribosome quality control (RQC) complex YloA/Tae2 family protein
MLETNRFQNAAQSLEQINVWQLEQEAKEEKQKFLIQEKKRKEQQIKQERNYEISSVISSLSCPKTVF